MEYWTILRCGIAGVYVMGITVAVKLLAGLPRFFANNWTWTELLVLPACVIALGFGTGVTVGLALPLARIGRIGDAIIGAICGNVYLLICLALFDTQALLNPQIGMALLFCAIATLLGSGLALWIGHDLRKPSTLDTVGEQCDAPERNGVT